MPTTEIAADVCTYAIGDIHGCADLLKKLLAAIQEDSNDKQWKSRIIFLGDIIDHGPHSRSAMDLVCKTLKESPDSKLLLGNHDNYLLQFMTAETIDKTKFDRWLQRIGGYATFLSYGLDHFRTLEDMATYFREEYPEHLFALENAERIIVDRKYAFVHAGIDPDHPLEKQNDYDLMWIREKFLDFDGPLPQVVVHGHTPSRDALPVLKPNRIGIDTGAYATNVLTCLGISPDQSELSFISIVGSIYGSFIVHRDDFRLLNQIGKQTDLSGKFSRGGRHNLYIG